MNIDFSTDCVVGLRTVLLGGFWPTWKLPKRI